MWRRGFRGMEEQINKGIVRGALLNSPYQYFVHLKRLKNFRRFRKKDLLVFPQMCSICGSELVVGHVGIGRPSLFLFTHVGYVPYCQKHYVAVAAKQEYNAFVLRAIMIIMFLALFVGVWIFGIEAGGIIKTVLYFTTLPALIFIRYFANLKYRAKMGLNDFDENLMLPVMSRNLILYFIFSFVLMLIGWFSGNAGYYIVSVLSLGMAFVREQLKGQTEVEQIIEADQVTKLGGVQVASYDVGFYTLGFMNEGQFSKFVNLNQEKIIYSETRDELLEKSHVS